MVRIFYLPANILLDVYDFFLSYDFDFLSRNLIIIFVFIFFCCLEIYALWDGGGPELINFFLWRFLRPHEWDTNYHQKWKHLLKIKLLIKDCYFVRFFLGFNDLSGCFLRYWTVGDFFGDFDFWLELGFEFCPGVQKGRGYSRDCEKVLKERTEKVITARWI